MFVLILCFFFLRYSYASPLGIKSRIIGSRARLEDYPYNVKVAYGDYPYTKGICGGSILNHRWILSAANYKYKFEMDPTYVAADNHGGQLFKIHRVVVHPKFNPDTFLNDLMLIQVHKDIYFNKYVQPVVLPSVKHKKLRGKISGYGGPDPEEGLKIARVYEVTQFQYFPECERTTKFFDDPRLICVSSTYVEKACSGDEGDPFVIHDKSKNQYIQYGLVAIADICNQYNKANILTRVSKYVVWIQENIN